MQFDADLQELGIKQDSALKAAFRGMGEAQAASSAALISSMHLSPGPLGRSVDAAPAAVLRATGRMQMAEVTNLQDLATRKERRLQPQPLAATEGAVQRKLVSTPHSGITPLLGESPPSAAQLLVWTSLYCFSEFSWTEQGDDAHHLMRQALRDVWLRLGAERPRPGDDAAEGAVEDKSAAEQLLELTGDIDQGLCLQVTNEITLAPSSGLPINSSRQTIYKASLWQNESPFRNPHSDAPHRV